MISDVSAGVCSRPFACRFEPHPGIPFQQRGVKNGDVNLLIALLWSDNLQNRLHQNRAIPFAARGESDVDIGQKPGGSIIVIRFVVIAKGGDTNQRGADEDADVVGRVFRVYIA